MAGCQIEKGFCEVYGHKATTDDSEKQTNDCAITIPQDGVIYSKCF